MRDPTDENGGGPEATEETDEELASDISQLAGTSAAFKAMCKILLKGVDTSESQISESDANQLKIMYPGINNFSDKFVKSLPLSTSSSSRAVPPAPRHRHKAWSTG